MNESLPSGHYYELTLKGKRVGFCSISKFPHPIAKDIYTISRLVIVPEFQGFGLGIKFMNEISLLYKGNRIRITTSLKSFMNALKVNKNWKCVRFGRVSAPGKSSKIHSINEKISVSHDRITATFEFILN